MQELPFPAKECASHWPGTHPCAPEHAQMPSITTCSQPPRRGGSFPVPPPRKKMLVLHQAIFCRGWREAPQQDRRPPLHTPHSLGHPPSRQPATMPQDASSLPAASRFAPKRETIPATRQSRMLPNGAHAPHAARGPRGSELARIQLEFEGIRQGNRLANPPRSAVRNAARRAPCARPRGLVPCRSGGNRGCPPGRTREASALDRSLRSRPRPPLAGGATWMRPSTSSTRHPSGAAALNATKASSTDETVFLSMSVCGGAGSGAISATVDLLRTERHSQPGRAADGPMRQMSSIRGGIQCSRSLTPAPAPGPAQQDPRTARAASAAPARRTPGHPHGIPPCR